MRPKFGEQGTVDIWKSWLTEGLEEEFRRCVEAVELRGARQLLDEFIDWQAVASKPLAAKEKFGLALLLEAVDTLMLSRNFPDSELPLQWEMR